jgi:hypothetical protein
MNFAAAPKSKCLRFEAATELNKLGSSFFQLVLYKLGVMVLEQP